MLIDDGTVNANVLRREALDKRTLELVDKGKQTVCDPFWVAKLRAGSLWVSNTMQHDRRRQTHGRFNLGVK